MKLHARIKTVSAVVACCLALGMAAGLLGIGLTPQARANTIYASADPMVGDYQVAQQELEQHLEQRLKLHLARMARNGR